MSHIKGNPRGERFSTCCSSRFLVADPYPSEKTNASAGIFSYANRHRFAQLAVFEVKMIGAPVSYARAAYHAVHTFWWKVKMAFAAPFVFPGNRSQAFATPILRPCRTTIICARNSTTG